MDNSLFSTYFRYVEHTEPPIVFHRWCLLTGLGACLGRQYYLPFGEFNVFPNMYVMLMGNPGTRKSTAIKLSRKVFSAAGYTKFAATKTTKEKFLLDLEGVVDDEGKIIAGNDVMQSMFGEGMYGDPKEVYITADEFNEFVGSGNLEFLSLLGTLWDWDDQSAPFTQRLKNSRSVSINQPTVSILAGNTHTGFAEAFPPQSIGQGFLSRLILVHGEASGRKIAFPERPSDELRLELVNQLMEIRAKVSGPATMSKRAREMIETIYRTFPGLDDVRFHHYSTRRYTHFLKLCLLCAATHHRTEIQAEDVLYANTLLSFTEHRMPQAMGEFGKAKDSDVSAKIMEVLNQADKPLEVGDLWKQVRNDLNRIEDLQKLLMNLLQGQQVQYIGKKANTTGPTGYLPVRKALSGNQIYVDYSLLEETKRR